ncbi:MAG: flagellar type III secretion system pore protein FliP [Spirochaetia bacterium]|nr:flagellar type III secretion system pore protein FliP [Spirochaetia bacterium]
MRKTVLLILLLSILLPAFSFAQEAENKDGAAIPSLEINIKDSSSNKEMASSIKLLLLLAVIAVAPSVLLLATCFVRIAVVLDFVKRSLSLQNTPPNQLILGLAIFLTLFVMWPVFENIYNDSFKPFSQEEIDAQEMYSRAEQPLRLFMYNQLKAHPDNIRLFMSMRGLPKPANLSEVPTYVLVPAFALNELTIAFKIGILLFIPFIVIDMIVASALMSLGMVMVPPAMVSLPFKLILFVLVDGWNLIVGQLLSSFVM